MLALLVVGGLFWAKYNVTTIKQWRGGNAWYLGYEAAAVRYRHNPDRFKKNVSDERCWGRRSFRGGLRSASTPERQPAWR